jgi:RNA polymerase sigma factor (sigma-70 family)
MLGSRTAAEDVASVAIVKMLQSERVPENESRMQAYVYTIARNLCIDLIRKEARLRITYVENVASIKEAYIEEENWIELRRKVSIETKRVASIYQVASKLPRQQREIFCLRFKEEKTIEQIAFKMELTHRTVYNHLSLAVRHIRKSLKGWDLLIVLVTIGWALF